MAIHCAAMQGRSDGIRMLLQNEQSQDLIQKLNSQTSVSHT